MTTRWSFPPVVTLMPRASARCSGDRSSLNVSPVQRWYQSCVAAEGAGPGESDLGAPGQRLYEWTGGTGAGVRRSPCAGSPGALSRTNDAGVAGPDRSRANPRWRSGVRAPAARQRFRRGPGGRSPFAVRSPRADRGGVRPSAVPASASRSRSTR